MGVTSLIVGVIYATRKQFMKYHKEAIGVDWNEIDKKHINNNNGSYENRWFWIYDKWS